METLLELRRRPPTPLIFTMMEGREEISKYQWKAGRMNERKQGEKRGKPGEISKEEQGKRSIT